MFTLLRDESGDGSKQAQEIRLTPWHELPLDKLLG